MPTDDDNTIKFPNGATAKLHATPGDAPYQSVGELLGGALGDLSKMAATKPQAPAGPPPPPQAPPGMISSLVARERGVPRAHLDRLYDAHPELPDLEDSRAMRAVRAWEERGRHLWCLVLHGPARRGKSLAAAWWACQARDVPATWVSAEEYTQTLRGERSRAKWIAGSTLLVIDDLGEEYLDQSGFALHAIQRLISTRWDSSLRTLITTNLRVGDEGNNRDQLVARYGDRMAGRINEGATVRASGPVLGVSA